MNRKNAALCKQLFFLFCGPLACMLIKDLPPLHGMAEDGMVCLAGGAWLVLWWMSEAFPLPVTSLLAIPIFGFLGVMAPEKVFATIGNPAMMLILGSTIIVGIWKESNLIERYAYWCFNLPFIQGKIERLILVFVLGCGVMSAIAPNIPLAILFISVSVAIARSCGLTGENNIMRCLCTMSAVAPSIGGVGTPLGGAPNIVAIAVIATTLDREVSFWEWSRLGMPICLAGLLVIAVFVLRFFPPEKGAARGIPQDYLKERLASLGRVSFHEHVAVWTMAIALVLWCAGPQIFDALGMPGVSGMMTSAFVAMLMGAATFLVPIRREEASGRLVFAMSWKQALHNIGWDIIILQIGAIAFGQILLQGGVDKSFAHYMQLLLGDVSGVWVWFFLVLLTALVGQIIISFALIPLMIPITASLAVVYGFDPLVACLSVSFVVNLSTMFPFASVPVAVIMGAGEGYANARDFLGVGLFCALSMTIISFLFCWLAGPLLVQ